MTAMILVICLTIYQARKEHRTEAFQSMSNAHKGDTTGQLVWLLFSGLLVLLMSAKLLVWGAVGLAGAFGVSDLVIGLTIVAVGTSLPELAASISAVKKGQHDMAVGNIIGSSLFNILAVLGVVGIVGPDSFNHDVIERDYPIMLGLVVLFYLGTRRIPPKDSIIIPQWLGGLLLLLFFIYQSVILFGGNSP